MTFEEFDIFYDKEFQERQNVEPFYDNDNNDNNDKLNKDTEDIIPKIECNKKRNNKKKKKKKGNNKNIKTFFSNNNNLEAQFTNQVDNHIQEPDFLGNRLYLFNEMTNSSIFCCSTTITTKKNINTSNNSENSTNGISNLVNNRVQNTTTYLIVNNVNISPQDILDDKSEKISELHENDCEDKAAPPISTKDCKSDPEEDQTSEEKSSSTANLTGRKRKRQS